MYQFSVDESLCTHCGLCAVDCPACIIDQEGDGLPSISPDKEELCYKCQHCLAVCPTGAISILGKNPADSRPLSSASFPSFEQMDHFIRSRRSIRHYQDKNVDPSLISNLLKTLAYAPTGVNMQELTFNVIDDKDVMSRFRDTLFATLAEATAKDSFPEQFARLKEIAELPRDVASRLIFRGAPHALIVSGPPEALCVDADVVLSVAYFDLLAQSTGLGTLWWGYLKFILTAVPELKSVLGIPEDHVFYGALFGLPAIKYARTTQKDNVAEIKRVTL